MTSTKKQQPQWKKRLHEIIYGTNTRAGRLFDVLLLVVISISIILVMLESIPSLSERYPTFFDIFEWVITIIFTIEYLARIIVIKKPIKYIFSFYGIIDLVSTIPKYLSFFMGGFHALLAVRALRLLRVFRILKLTRYVSESNSLVNALKASKAKISVFLFAVLILAIIMGTLMYLVEGAESGFSNIPVSVYWCIVTLTTVGYGDIAPATPAGQFIAAIIMIIGYGIIAVPTGIVSAEYVQQKKTTKKSDMPVCPNCDKAKHDIQAEYCNRCGHELSNEF